MTYIFDVNANRPFLIGELQKILFPKLPCSGRCIAFFACLTHPIRVDVPLRKRRRSFPVFIPCTEKIDVLIFEEKNKEDPKTREKEIQKKKRSAICQKQNLTIAPQLFPFS